MVRAAEARGLKTVPADEVIEAPGAGLSRRISGGGEERLGSADWCGVDRDPGIADDARAAASLWYRPAGGGAATAFRFVDALRADAVDTVKALRSAGFGVVLLSGDQVAAVKSAAETAGIEDWFARQRPDEKIAQLKRLEAEGRCVLMVGDGLNDAPALAAAHASMSPASAVEVSQIASDGIIQGHRLAPLTETIAVARQTRRMSLQNFAIAAAYNAICIPLAMAGFVTPLIAAIAMSASSIVVTANAMRLTTAKLKL